MVKPGILYERSDNSCILVGCFITLVLFVCTKVTTKEKSYKLFNSSLLLAKSPNVTQQKKSCSIYINIILHVISDMENIIDCTNMLFNMTGLPD